MGTPLKGYSLDAISQGLNSLGIATQKVMDYQLGLQKLYFSPSSDPRVQGTASIILGISAIGGVFWFLSGDHSESLSEKDRYRNFSGEVPNRSPEENNTALVKEIAAAIYKLRQTAPEKKDEVSPETPWSVVSMHDGYAAHVLVFANKKDAMKEAQDRGRVYLVKGTQMWNEPLGQVEEHNRVAHHQWVN